MGGHGLFNLQGSANAGPRVRLRGVRAYPNQETERSER